MGRLSIQLAGIVTLLLTSPAIAQEWEPFGLDQFDIRFLTTDGQQLFACAYDPPFGNGRGFYSRDLLDAQAGWEHRGFDGVGLSSIWIHPTFTQILFVTVLEDRSDGKVFRSLDSGRTWERADHGLPPGRVWKVTGSTAVQPEMLLATETGVYRSTNLGDTWNWIDRCDATSKTQDVLFDSGRNVRYFAKLDSGRETGIWRFQPGDLPKAALTNPSNIHQMRLSADGCLFATTGMPIGGVVVSDDGGEEWTPLPIDEGGVFYGLATSPLSRRELLVSRLMSDDPLRYSEDGGLSWRSLSDGLADGTSTILSLEADPNDLGVFYLGHAIQNQGVMRIRTKARGRATMEPDSDREFGTGRTDD